MKKRLGSLECIYIIRDIYFKNTIERFIEQGEKCLFVGGGKGSSLYDYCKKGLKITFTDISQDAINCVKKHQSLENLQSISIVVPPTSYHILIRNSILL